MFKKSITLVLTFLLTFSFASSTVFAGSVKIMQGKPGTPGAWYAGDTPDHLDPEKPVILFVPGLSSPASFWWLLSDMYETAYEAGYQTAFVELNDSVLTPKDMWTNGKVLADVIKQVSDYYQKELVIVGHSKGGIDTQAALIHNGAYPYVSRVITLGSPHHGSEVADLAYSKWAGWLADLIGAQNEGVYSLQTGYMSYYRSVTDAHPNRSKTPYYTLAGDGWNSSLLSPLVLGGLYLSAFGKNDGLVTVKSAQLPYASMLRVGKWNHLDVAQGSKTFSIFAPYLTGEKTISASSRHIKKAAAQTLDNSDIYVRGGSFSKEAGESFLVENGVKEVTVDMISAQPLREVNFTSPTGEMVRADLETFQDDQLFKGAWHTVATIKKPAEGSWRLQAESKNNGDNAYLMTVHYDSTLSGEITLTKKNDKWNVIVNKRVIDKKNIDVRYHVQYVADPLNKRSGKAKGKSWKSKQLTSADSYEIDMKKAGIYNVTVDIAGKTAKGVPFTRTVIESVYVDEKGKVYQAK